MTLEQAIILSFVGYCVWLFIITVKLDDIYRELRKIRKLTKILF